jgi:hypothetical protein
MWNSIRLKETEFRFIEKESSNSPVRKVRRFSHIGWSVVMEGIEFGATSIEGEVCLADSQ